MPAQPKRFCTRCGSQMAKRSHNEPLPRSAPVCLACRKIAPATNGPYGRVHGPKPESAYRQCACGEWFEPYRPTAVSCSKKRDQRRRNPIPRSISDDRTQRHLRELAAPGLTRWKRAAILRKWISQSRRCAYCPAPATTIDHVMPLWLGGTSFEGNLTPACRSCNASKGWLLPIEWRLRRDAKLQRMRQRLRSTAA